LTANTGLRPLGLKLSATLTGKVKRAGSSVVDTENVVDTGKGMGAVHSIGITGHIHLTRVTKHLVRHALIDYLSRPADTIHGVSCLAPGPDQMFVAAIVRLGGTYDVVLPARDYPDQVIGWRGRRAFDKLLARAREVIPAEFDHSGAEAYAFANTQLVARSQELIAVWDGRSDDQPGSTAHAVALARESSVPLVQIWPAGARRADHADHRRASPRGVTARPAVGSATR